MNVIHKYPYIIDINGAHWLVNKKSQTYFNGVLWVKKDAPIKAEVSVGEVTIEEFLIILSTALNYDKVI